jgi:ParB/RepB/Spo0J family partition protein
MIPEEGWLGKIMAKLPIGKIKVRNRYRKSLGDVASLAASIKELGLLHPIVGRPDGRLIAGERRLAACKRLGWKSVPVTYVDLKEVVRGEFAENAFRKDFLPSEIEAIRRAIEPYERAAAKERQRKHAGTAPGRKHSGKLSRSEVRSRDRIGCFAGISGRSLAKIQAVVEAAERNPRRFRPLVAEMDQNGRIDAAYRKLRRMKDEEQRLAVKPLSGKFRTLCIDPPWAYSVHHERARPTYATMSQRELLALPRLSWADEQAHLYLWSTNADLRDAFELMEPGVFSLKPY